MFDFQLLIRSFGFFQQQSGASAPHFSHLKSCFMSEWFQSKVKFLRQMDNGLIKEIKEVYLVDSMSFTECEARVFEQVGEGMREITMMAIAKSPIKEVVFYGDTDLWWKVCVKYELQDEESDKVKKITTYLLVNANDLKESYERTEEHLREMIVPFRITKSEESPIVDVFEYKKEARPRHVVDKATDLRNEAITKADQLIESKIGAVDPTNGQAVAFEVFDAKEWHDNLSEPQKATITHNFSTMYLGGDASEFVSYLSGFDLETEQVTAVIEWLEGGDDSEEDEQDCAMDAVAVDIEATNLIGALSPSERKTLMIVHGCAESESVFAERNGWTPQQLRKVIDHLDNMDAFDADEEDGGTDLESRLDRAFAAQTEID